jgi:WD40 repeat protein
MASDHNVFYNIFLDNKIMVVGDRLVTDNNESSIQVHHVLTGQLLHTIASSKYASAILCMSQVPDHTEWIVTGGKEGDVHLWDIDAGT